MKVLIYVVPAFFTLIMFINGAMHYWGHFDKEATEAVFYHYIPSKREERNWKLSQKIYGKNLLIAGVLNIITELALIPVANHLADVAEQLDGVSAGMLAVMFLPSLVYLLGAWLLMQWKLKCFEEAEQLEVELSEDYKVNDSSNK